MLFLQPHRRRLAIKYLLKRIARIFVTEIIRIWGQQQLRAVDFSAFAIFRSI